MADLLISEADVEKRCDEFGVFDVVRDLIEVERKRDARIATLEAEREEFILLARKIDRGLWPDEVADNEAMGAWRKVLALDVSP